MHKYYLAALLIGSLTLISSSCWRSPSSLASQFGDKSQQEIAEGQDLVAKPAHEQDSLTEDQQATITEIIKARCVVERFALGENDGLYGKDNCLTKDRYIVIKTAGTGKQVATSNSKGNEEDNTPDGLRTEGDVFMNKVYDLQYEHKKGEGDDKNIFWLAQDFLPLSDKLKQPFLGSPDTEYKIVFRLEGGYLMLYKASTDLKKIPYIERTSVITEDLHDAGTHYMVPFIGYPVKYCDARFQKTPEGKERILKEKHCENVKAEEAKYVYIDLSKGENSHKAFIYDEKNDLFEADYFKGRWFYVEGDIETVSTSNDTVPEIGSRYTNLIKFIPEAESLSLVNISDLTEEESDIQKTHKYKSRQFPIRWRKYEFYADDKKLEEKSIADRGDPTTSRFFTIRMPNISEDVMEVFVTPNYFSIIYRKDIPGTGDRPAPKPKRQITFYREKAVDNKNFHERKWFFDDSNFFGVIPTIPNDFSQEPAAYNEEERNKFWRMTRFNLDNPGPNKVLWHFSENSTKDPYFRSIAKEAVEIYHQGFQVITSGTDKWISVELIENKPQQLGDLRYNILNLVYLEKQIINRVLGRAPSYVNPLNRPDYRRNGKYLFRHYTGYSLSTGQPIHKV